MVLRLTALAGMMAVATASVFAGDVLSVGDFSGLQVSGGIQVEVTNGPCRVERLSGKASSLSVSVEDHVLVLKRQFTWQFWNFVGPVRFAVSMPKLTSVDLSGGSQATLPESLGGSGDLEVGLSGGSHLHGAWKGRSLRADLSGGSGIDVRGEAESLELTASGGSWFRSPPFRVNDGAFQLSGGSGARLTVVHSVSVEASGGSSLEYAGSAPVSQQKLSGGASVRTLR